MATYAADKPKEGKASHAAILEKAKKCWKLAVDAEAEQRRREREDLRFQVGEYQWSEAARKERAGNAAEDKPPRPMLSISKIDHPIQLVLNQAKAARLGVNIHPVSEEADDDTAEVMQGIYRRIERDSNADQARLWALDRAVKAGRGVYRVNTKWDEDSPDTFDQEIVIERILHQETVYFDPSAQKPDYSDGKWAFVSAWMSAEDFEKEYPDAEQTPTGDDFQADAIEPGWVSQDGEDKAVLVCEYWYKVISKEKVKVGDREREREIVKVRRATMTGFEVLDDIEWNGRFIPLIPVLGKELQPFDTERRYQGMIGPSRDGQQLYNFAASSLVESMALEPKAPWVMAEGQDEGFEGEWKTSNIRNIPVLHYRLKTIDGQPAPPPQRAQVDGQRMQLSMMALQEADSFIQATTSIYDPSLGRENPRDKSGKAILALQSQSDAGTSHYLQSLADVSMAYEARVVLDLMPAIYDRPGRITRVLGGEDETRTVMLNAPFRMGPNGRPQGVPVPVAPKGSPPILPQGAKQYDLRKGTYTISVTVGKSYQTRLQEGSDEIGAILSAQPELMPLLGATYFRFRDFPGAKEIAKILKKVREQQMPGLEEEEGEETVDGLKAKLQAMQQKGQEMAMRLEEAAKAMATDKAKQEATIEKAKMDNASREKIAAENNQTKLIITKLENLAEQMQLLTKQRVDVQLEHEGMAHEVAMAAAGGNTMTRTRNQGREQEGEQGQEQNNGRSASSAPPNKGGE